MNRGKCGVLVISIDLFRYFIDAYDIFCDEYKLQKF